MKSQLGKQDGPVMHLQETKSSLKDGHFRKSGSRESLDGMDVDKRCPPCSIIVGFQVMLVTSWVLLLIPIVWYHVPIEMIDHNSTDIIPSMESTIPLNCTVTCRQDFFCKAGTNKCVPECESFKQWSPSITTFVRVFTIAISIIGLVSGVVVLVISFKRWKTVCTFPSIFIVYEDITVIILLFFFIISYFDQEGLFCKSRDLGESVMSGTPFCVIIGIAFAFIPLQLALWWLFHTTMSFWKIRLPLHYRDFKLAHGTKYVHVGCVLAGFLLPLIPVIVVMVHGAINNTAAMTGMLGFQIALFPPSLCGVANGNALYYSVALPLGIILIIGTPFLLLMFWTIHKQQGIFQRRMTLSKSTKSKGPNIKRRLLIVTVHYILFGFLGNMYFVVQARTSRNFRDELTLYFLCESNGYDPNTPCDRSEFEALKTPSLALYTVSLLLLGLFPISGMVYILDIDLLKKKLKSCFHYRVHDSI